uniref:DNA primase n=1 Tax=Clastoptera arizonana TaxID=38151 RepID=A0A1B6BYA8_9HEMI
MPQFSPEQLPDLLPQYYKRLFPFDPYYRWLSYGNINKSDFENREFSFTLESDVYIRYRSFTNLKDMEKTIQSTCPYKIDIGAVYTSRPSTHRRNNIFAPVQKELVFDIDMTDYDDVRSCCNGADVCTKCWKFMSIATKILDTALRDDFGFEHILWVFSGRRGIHCWVCDESARTLDTPARSAVAEYLQLISGGGEQWKKINLYGEYLHPSVIRAATVIKEQFENVCIEDQNILGSNESVEKFLKLITDDSLRNEIEKGFSNHSSSKDRWGVFMKCFEYYKTSGKLKKRNKHLLEEIMLKYAYPRLDINVSKGFNHLLKSPFCIHPKTGKVCIPFNPRGASKFDPTNVPTISELLEEVMQFDKKLNESMEDNGDVKKVKVKDYKKTSMKKGVFIFEEFVTKLESTWKGKRIQLSDLKMEF